MDNKIKETKARNWINSWTLLESRKKMRSMKGTQMLIIVGIRGTIPKNPEKRFWELVNKVKTETVTAEIGLEES